MLWFNFTMLASLALPLIISIHLMLWFNFLLREFGMSDISFQYILCYGSTFRLLIVLKEFKGFQYILCYGSTNPTYFLKSSKILISIHLMLWFNAVKRLFVDVNEHFNTSYVMVQPLLVCDCYFLLY